MSGLCLYSFYEAPTEVTDQPTIVRDDPAGGDPLTVAVLKRVHRPEEVYELCRLANEQVRAEGKRHAEGGAVSE